MVSSFIRYRIDFCRGMIWGFYVHNNEQETEKQGNIKYKIERIRVSFMSTVQIVTLH